MFNFLYFVRIDTSSANPSLGSSDNNNFDMDFFNSIKEFDFAIGWNMCYVTIKCINLVGDISTFNLGNFYINPYLGLISYGCDY